eukprot:814806-Amorphochlora_amoeboformis.AAC.1
MQSYASGTRGNDKRSKGKSDGESDMVLGTSVRSLSGAPCGFGIATGGSNSKSGALLESFVKAAGDSDMLSGTR